jgi:hypothetical protein
MLKVDANKVSSDEEEEELIEGKAIISQWG